MKSFKLLTVFLLTFLVSFVIYAQEAVKDLAPADFLSQVGEAYVKFGGMNWAMKVATICLLAVASIKVSFFRQLFWDKLGVFKAWAAPVLSLVAGLLSLGTSITLPQVFAFLSAGAGAVILSELLELVKAIPGLGEIYISIINFIEGILGAEKQ